MRGFVVGLVFVALSACRGERRHPPTVHGTGNASGLFWGRLNEVPAGMRVQVWLDDDGHRVRGAYSAPPYMGEVEGAWQTDGSVQVVRIEHGFTRTVADRLRRVTLRWNRAHTALAGVDSAGVPCELLRAGFLSPALHTATWIAHWTGLTPGMAVETRLSQTPDGHWRGAYQYQGGGGVREGSFDGTPVGDALELQWTEVSESGTLARGRGRLTPSVFGLRGTFGIDGSAEGIGEWALEPLEP